MSLLIQFYEEMLLFYEEVEEIHMETGLQVLEKQT